MRQSCICEVLEQHVVGDLLHCRERLRGAPTSGAQQGHWIVRGTSSVALWSAGNLAQCLPEPEGTVTDPPTGPADVARSACTSELRSDALRENPPQGAEFSPVNVLDSDALILDAAVFFPLLVLVLAITVLWVFV